MAESVAPDCAERFAKALARIESGIAKDARNAVRGGVRECPEAARREFMANWMAECAQRTEAARREFEAKRDDVDEAKPAALRLAICEALRDAVVARAERMGVRPR